ncbi:MAG: hypothetical protein FWF18_01310 [Dehalococcoidia bacterium]|nr:hypothetical protein [Dehalococcoidia bacterium]
MKKVLSVIFCALLLTSSVLASVSCSSDDSAPEFEGDPVSVTGEMKWVEDRVLLDFTITNNTNKGIHLIYFAYARSYWMENEHDWWPYEAPINLLTGKVSEMPFNTHSCWRTKIWPPTIKPGESKVFSYNVGPLRFSNQIGPDTYAKACKYRLTVTRIEFKGYGYMYFEDSSMVYEFEWHKEHN